MKVISVVLFILCALSGNAQDVQLAVKTLKCDMGKRYYPIHVSVSIYDAEKVPEIVKTAIDLSNENDPNSINRALTLYERLKKLVRDTPPLAGVTSLPTSKYLFHFSHVNHVIVISFGESEFDPIVFAMKDMNVSSDRVNQAELNFSTEDECKGAK